MNYLSEVELNSIKGLLHYLNQNLPGNEGSTYEGKIFDSSGEYAGSITYQHDAGGYVLGFGEPA